MEDRIPGREGASAPSLLDRLTPEPQTGAASADPLRELKASLCRDLSALLNTRRAENDFDPEFAESANSILTFGITDFTALNLRNAADQERLRLSLERSIRQFEPRLARIKVHIQQPDSIRPVVRFEISAMIRVNGYSEDVRFDATLHRDSRRVAVSGGIS